MKNLQGVIAFVETARAGSLTAAATRLELTPAAISKGVARLEAQLGVRLLQRNTRRSALTAEGERFFERAVAGLRQLDEAVAEVGRARTAAVGRVRLSVAAGFGRRWVLPLLPALQRRHPGLVIEVDLDNRPVDLLAEGYDIGIRGGVIEDSSLVARRICALPAVLAASPAYLREAGVPAAPQELAAHRCVAVRFAHSGTPPWPFRLANGRRWEFAPEAPITVSDPEALAELALAGGGIVQTSLAHALPYLRSARLKLLLADNHDAGTREVVLHYPHRRYLAPRVRVVVDELLEHLAVEADLQLSVAEAVAQWPQWVAAAAVPSPRSTRPPRTARAAPR